MPDKFLELSRQIANGFIQSIVFIDDKAYTNDTTANAFSASDISTTFAETGKICAIYAPKSTSDIENYHDVLKKADVVILDWYLNIENDKDELSDPESDADNDEPRGEYTLSLISELLGTNMLKLLIIYTGETNLPEITDDIYKKLEANNFEKGDCIVKSPNAKILIRAKAQDTENQFAYNPQLKDKIVPHNKLPDLIVDEFTGMTNGLLSNFALASISAIRENTSRILSVFSPKLDPAYLGHKLSLENPAESKLLLMKLFGDSISELLEATDINTDDWVNNWIDGHIEDKKLIINKISISRTKDMLKKMLVSEKNDLKDKYKECTGIDMPSILKSETAKLFECEGIDTEESNVGFAILTHHKNIFHPKAGTPVLTLGTIIKDTKASKDSQGQSPQYYVCIQQRCDSVRIQETRRFLFLPLTTQGEHSLIIQKGLTMFPEKKSFALKTIKFSPSAGSTTIQAISKDGKYIFRSCHNDEYEWIVDLKEMQSQRILNSYCSMLSRVGLNESEWLRMRGR